MAHNEVAELDEKLALQWLCEKVCDHFEGRTKLDTEVACVDAIGDEKVVDVHVPSAFHARSTSIIFHVDGALVVLVQNSTTSLVALCFEKVVHPK